ELAKRAVMLARQRPGPVQLDRLPEFVYRTGGLTRELDQRGPGEVVLAGDRETKLSADCQQVVGVVRVPYPLGLRDQRGSVLRVAEPGRRPGPDQLQLRRVRPAWQVREAALGQLGGAQRLPAPQRRDRQVQPQLRR